MLLIRVASFTFVCPFTATKHYELFSTEYGINWSTYSSVNLYFLKEMGNASTFPSENDQASIAASINTSLDEHCCFIVTSEYWGTEIKGPKNLFHSKIRVVFDP